MSEAPTPARVRVLPDPESGPVTTAGPVKSIQEALRDRIVSETYQCLIQRTVLTCRSSKSRPF